jgi:hypothetical protein
MMEAETKKMKKVFVSSVVAIILTMNMQPCESWNLFIFHILTLQSLALALLPQLFWYIDSAPRFIRTIHNESFLSAKKFHLFC